MITSILGGVLGKILDKFLPERAKNFESQTDINEKEIEGAPPSLLRLWRPFLGWILAVVFAWEIIGRLMIIPVFFPTFSQKLPPSEVDTIVSLLLGMLGLG